MDRSAHMMVATPRWVEEIEDDARSGRSRRNLPRGFGRGRGEDSTMLRRFVLSGLLGVAAFGALSTQDADLSGAAEAQAQQVGQPNDWQRFYYYPYVYYPHNFQPPVQYDSMYYKYPAERRIPVYNKDWYNFYPTEKPWYKGHHNILDVF